MGRRLPPLGAASARVLARRSLGAGAARTLAATARDWRLSAHRVRILNDRGRPGPVVIARPLPHGHGRRAWGRQSVLVALRTCARLRRPPGAGAVRDDPCHVSGHPGWIRRRRDTSARANVACGDINRVLSRRGHGCADPDQRHRAQAGYRDAASPADDRERHPACISISEDVARGFCRCRNAVRCLGKRPSVHVLLSGPLEATRQRL